MHLIVWDKSAAKRIEKLTAQEFDKKRSRLVARADFWSFRILRSSSSQAENCSSRRRRASAGSLTWSNTRCDSPVPGPGMVQLSTAKAEAG